MIENDERKWWIKKIENVLYSKCYVVNNMQPVLCMHEMQLLVVITMDPDISVSLIQS